MSGEDPAREDFELEELLRRVRPEPSDPRRREEARRAFLAGGAGLREGASRSAGADRIGRGMGLEERIDEHDGFVDWLAARGAAAPARPEALRRARLAFLSAVAGDVRPRNRERRSVRALVVALAAAAILAVTFLLPEAERWQVRLEGPLRFAGREYGPADGARLATALEGAGRVETGGGRTRFVLGDGLVIELSAGAIVDFPVLPELDGITTMAFELARGEAFLRTSPSYPGNPILVRTAQADVTLSGTTVGVLVADFGTCVCVAEGKVRVTGTRLPGNEQDVAARTTLRVFEAEGVEVQVEPFPEEDGVEAQHTRALVEFGRGGRG